MVLKIFKNFYVVLWVSNFSKCKVWSGIDFNCVSGFNNIF